jgi:predicted aldo/keto reductase-like oxidoreductase
MSQKNSEMNRRDFLKITGLAGITSLAASVPLQTAETAKTSLPSSGNMPLREFGKTGVKVPILGLGGMFDITTNLIVLKKALDWGVTYWDTADCYNGGNSEAGIGMFFEKFPDARKKVFLVTKSDNRDPAGLTQLLERSLSRMKTDYIDLYFIHGVGNISELTPEMKAWVKNAKAKGKIKFFGFSTHSNMANCLMGASKLDWVDGIMLAYNFRLMNEDAMKRAVDACQKAGIGLTAMKTQGGGSVRTDSEQELALAGKFMAKGFTPQQAKMKAVWQNPLISTICSQMPNLTVLSANAAAALDKTKLSSSEMNHLNQYAANTCSHYCAGCRENCEAALPQTPVIADVMRYMMYYRNYGNLELAREKFAEIPVDVRQRLAKQDWSYAEKACPRQLPISKIMDEALKKLG